MVLGMNFFLIFKCGVVAQTELEALHVNPHNYTIQQDKIDT